MSVLPAAEHKPIYVQRMFDGIAARYDRVNRLMTFGLDQGWRRFAAAAATAGIASSTTPVRALDVGTGTGDFLPFLHRAVAGMIVVGVDFSTAMMRAGAAKAAALNGDGGYVGGDALRLPFADDSFDAITTGFAMRNVGDLHAALVEIRRVTRDGGRLACLEVARPRHRLARWGHQIYFNHLVPRIGQLVGGDREAYTYLPQSAAQFPDPDTLCDILAAAGWRQPRYHLLGLGAVAVHTAEK